MKSIFNEEHPGRATPDGRQAVSSLTGRKDPPPTADRGKSVKNLPNADTGGRQG